MNFIDIKMHGTTIKISNRTMKSTEQVLYLLKQRCLCFICNRTAYIFPVPSDPPWMTKYILDCQTPLE